jgi:ABC-type polysaccharide/polyol phosphate export permease
MRELLRFNPMAQVLRAYHELLFLGRFGHLWGLAAALAVALLAFALGAFLFERLRDTLVEEV